MAKKINFNIVIGYAFVIAISVAGFDAKSDSNIIEKRPMEKPDEYRLSIAKKDCTRLVNHVARGDVAYQSGVDSHGNSVAGADIQGSQMQMDIPDDIKFDLVINPFEYTGRSDLSDVFSNSSFDLGTIGYSITSGKMTLNGNPLTDAQQDIIAKSCLAQGIVK